MIYCMSDIHGEVERFWRMLSLIGFSDRDTLYIIGDVIDRNPGGAGLLKTILDTPNMVLLLVNILAREGRQSGEREPPFWKIRATVPLGESHLV